MQISAMNVNNVLDAIEGGQSVSAVRTMQSETDDHWHRLSSKAYAASLSKARKERKKNEKKRFTSVTSTDQVGEVVAINEELAKYALHIPILSTQQDVVAIKECMGGLPSSESKILNIIGDLTMNPRYRVMQKKGRFEFLKPFKNTSVFIDAATLCFYRKNYVSCYFTLAPVIEGVILRWMGFEDGDTKPEFEELRKFFNISHRRQPHPLNTEFHNVFTKVAHLVLNQHFFRPTTNGESYKDFNRHIASHLLKSSIFTTRENCIRLFLLLDTMTEIYVYEQREEDARWHLKDADMTEEIAIFSSLILECGNQSAEQRILNATSRSSS